MNIILVCTGLPATGTQLKMDKKLGLERRFLPDNDYVFNLRNPSLDNGEDIRHVVTNIVNLNNIIENAPQLQFKEDELELFRQELQALSQDLTWNELWRKACKRYIDWL